jgi:bacterioferritin (cytochrome b1)
MKGNAKVITVLNQLHADELTAINQYMVRQVRALSWRPAAYTRCLSCLNSTANKTMISNQLALNELMKQMTRLETLRKKKILRLFS